MTLSATMRGAFPRWDATSERNGELLALAAAEFDVFLTVDRNRSYQQDVSAFNIAVVSWLREATALTTCARLRLKFWRLLPRRSAVG
jgi:hypothetical protein